MDVYDLVQRGDALKGQVVTVRGRVAAGVEVAGAAGYRLEGDKGASVLVLAQPMPPIQSETVVTGVLKRSLDISFGGATLQGPSYIDTTSPAEGR
ncbi:MAG: hypothetical protein KKI08_25025 [Armatimonadetes bacterium]|nr:hypothetical protein [Armatimonadota bacterium]